MLQENCVLNGRCPGLKMFSSRELTVQFHIYWTYLPLTWSMVLSIDDPNETQGDAWCPV